MKVVIIGSQGHINCAIASMRNDKRNQLVGIASALPGDLDMNFANELAAATGVKVYHDYRKMLDEVKPEVACIATRYDGNGLVSLECLRRGINCFTEKSIAQSMVMLAELEQASRASGATIIGMHTMRYDAHFRAAWLAVNAGAVGTPTMVNGRKSYKFGNSRPDFYRSREFYGGTFLWVAIHAIDLGYWFCGDFSNITALHTTAGNFGYGECESACAMLFSTPNNGIGTITADFFQPGRSDVHGDDQLRIAGDKGIVEVLYGQAWLTTHEQPRTALPLDPPGDFFGDYCAALAGTGECRLSMADTFAVTRFALQARAAADRQ